MSGADPSPSNRLSTGADAAALTAWLVIQLLALGCSAFRVRFWAREPLAAEQLALAAMLVTQIAGASLLFPILLRNFRSTIVTVATAWPLALLASFLADADLNRLFWAEAYVTVWLIAFFLLARVIHTSRGQLIATGVAAMITLGASLLEYLRLDFNSERSFPERLSFFDPIGGVFSQIFPNHSCFAPWVFLGCFLACGVIVNLARRRQTR